MPLKQLGSLYLCDSSLDLVCKTNSQPQPVGQRSQDGLNVSINDIVVFKNRSIIINIFIIDCISNYNNCNYNVIQRIII